MRLWYAYSMKNTKKQTPNPAGREGRPLSLAPLTEADVLKKLLAAKPEKLQALKKPKKAKVAKKG